MINPLEEQVPETTVGTDEIDYKFGDTIETDENPTLAESSGTIIAEIQPALYGAFTKILSFLAQGTSSQDIVFIKDGKLNTRKSSGIIFSDMSDLFGDKSIEFIDPNNVVKLMSLIKGGEKISFINNNGQEYIISTIKDNKPDRIITLPIPDIAPTDVIEKPELNNCIFEMEVPVERIEDLVSAYKITEASYYIVDGMKYQCQQVQVKINCVYVKCYSCFTATCMDVFG